MRPALLHMWLGRRAGNGDTNYAEVNVLISCSEVSETNCFVDDLCTLQRTPVASSMTDP